MNGRKTEGFPSVLHVIRSGAWGGLEIYAYDLIKKIHFSGVRTAVYCIPGSFIYKSLKAAGITIFEAKSAKKISFADIMHIRAIVRKDKFDILHSHMNTDVWLCSPALLLDGKRKHLFSLYMTVIAKRNIIHKMLYKGIDMLISTSEKINEDVRLKYPINADKIKLIRYGRDVDQYFTEEAKRSNIRSYYNVKNDEVVVGTMCRIDPSKGVAEFAESFNYLPEEIRQRVKIWLIGDRTVTHTTISGEPVYEGGSEEVYQQIKQYAAVNGLGSNIKLIPFQKDLQGYLSALDIFVLASYNEMYSLAVLDAMLMKRPVIATNAGGTAEQIGNDERGKLIAPRSPQAIASAIEYFIAKPQDALKVAENAQKWVIEQHNWPNVLQHYFYSYKELMDKM